MEELNQFRLKLYNTPRVVNVLALHDQNLRAIYNLATSDGYSVKHILKFLYLNESFKGIPMQTLLIVSIC